MENIEDRILDMNKEAGTSDYFKLGLLVFALSQIVGGGLAGATAYAALKPKKIDVNLAQAQIMNKLWEQALTKARQKGKIQEKQKELVTGQEGYDWMK